MAKSRFVSYSNMVVWPTWEFTTSSSNRLALRNKYDLSLCLCGKIVPHTPCRTSRANTVIAGRDAYCVNENGRCPQHRSAGNLGEWGGRGIRFKTGMISCTVASSIVTHTVHGAQKTLSDLCIAFMCCFCLTGVISGPEGYVEAAESWGCGEEVRRRTGPDCTVAQHVGESIFRTPESFLCSSTFIVYPRRTAPLEGANSGRGGGVRAVHYGPRRLTRHMTEGEVITVMWDPRLHTYFAPLIRCRKVACFCIRYRCSWSVRTMHTITAVTRSTWGSRGTSK